MQIDEAILSALKFVHTYAQDVDDWLVIKKEIVKQVSPALRGQFSRRDEVTKLQLVNDFDRAVATQWSSMTGRPVVLKQGNAVQIISMNTAP